MNENEAAKCPKCNAEMKRRDKIVGYARAAMRILKYSDFRGGKVVPFQCENCGYIELYNEKSVDEE